nr:C80 family cysteine peptidase [Pseudomonas koreensis]
MGNAIIATPKLTIGANNVSNVQSGKILGDDIAIQAKNEVVSGTSASIKSNQIAIDADHFHGSNSEILATDNIDIKTSEYANTANISSQNTATLSIKNGGDFYSDQTQRAPQAEQLLTINAHDVTTNIELNNPGSIHINASGDVHNNQGIVTGKSLVVKAAGAIENAAEQIVFAAQDLILEAGTAISNLQDAQILGLGNVSLTASEVTNDRGRITSGADMSIDADTLTNRGAATGTAAVAGHSFVVGNYDWPHDGRSTSIIVGMNLPYYKSEISVTQAVIESSGDLNINQGAKHGRGGHITNADSLLTAAGNIKVDGNLSNTSTEASKSLYQLLNGTGEVTIGAQDSLAPLNPTKKIYASLWDLLSNTYGSDNNDHTIFAAYKYYDEDMSKTLQNTYNPVFNQLMSATFGADWRGLSRDELSNRFKNLQPSASLAFSGDKQAEISAGGTFTHTGGAFTNGGQQKVQQTVQVKVGDETISTLQGNFDRTFNSGVLFDFSKTPSLAELTAALNPQNVLERLMQTRALFDIHSAPPPLMLDVSKIGNRLSTSALGAEVARVNTSIVTTPVAASAPQAFTPIYPVYETRIPYITLKTFYGSQYFFDKIDYHSDRTVPVIGDAFFDNQLITQSIQETVGGYFAAKDGLSGAELVKTLMDNAALEAVAQGLHFGEPLTQAQYKNLTHNIIWYEPKVVNGYTVLSPRVYLSRATLEDVANNKATTAVVASRGQLSIDASKVSNVDAAIHGGSVYIHSADSIHNQNTGGGTGGIVADATLQLDAKGDVSNLGSTIAGQDVTIHTDGAFTDSARMGYDKKGSLVLKDRGLVYGGKDGSVSIVAGGDVNLTAAGIGAKDVNIEAGGNLTSNDVHQVSSSFKQTLETNGVPLGAVTIPLGVTSKTHTEVSATSVGSKLQGAADGGSLTLRAGKNITLQGGDYSADKGVVEARGEVRTLTGQDFSHTEDTMLSEGLSLGVKAGIAGKGVSAEYGPQGASASVINGDEANSTDAGTRDGGKPVLDGPLGAKVGYSRVETRDTRSQVHNYNANLNFGSSVTVQGGSTVDIGGANIQAVKDGKAGDLNIIGSEVVSTKFEDEDVQTHSRKDLFVGVSGTGSSSIADTVNHSVTLADKTQQGMTVDAGMTALQAVGDATNVVFNDTGALSAKEGIKYTESTSSSRTVRDNINLLKGNIKITSTQGNIALVGVNLDGTGAGVALDSAGDVSLTAAKSHSESQSSSQTHEASISINASVAPTGAGVGQSAGYTGSLDQTRTTATAYQNTEVLGDTVTIKAKKDLELTGAKVVGNDVNLDVAGNTRVTSVQDTSDMGHTVGNWGGNAGTAITTTSIVAPTGGANGGGGKDTDRSTLTAEQSGISAKNKLTAHLGGDLTLQGAHLISESGQGDLNVAGKIIAQQLHDSREKDGGSGGGGGGLSKTGLASVSVNVTRVDQVHYDATQNATIAGLQVKTGQGIEGTLNRDANKTLNVTRNEHIAGNDVSITAGIGDIKGFAGKLKNKTDTGSGETASGTSKHAPNIAQSRGESESVVKGNGGNNTEGFSATKPSRPAHPEHRADNTPAASAPVSRASDAPALHRQAGDQPMRAPDGVEQPLAPANPAGNGAGPVDAVKKIPTPGVTDSVLKSADSQGTPQTKPDAKYDSRVIVKLESDPTTDQAAQRIYDKHPANSVLLERDAQGQHTVVAGDPQSVGGKTKVELVGHGDKAADGSPTLGGLKANEVAQEVVKLREGASAPIEVKKVTAVGCDTGNCAKGPSLANHVGDKLHARAIEAPVKGYEGPTAVDEHGNKQPTSESNPDALGKKHKYNLADATKRENSTKNQANHEAVFDETPGTYRKLGENYLYRLDFRPPEVVLKEGFSGSTVWVNQLYGKNTVYSAHSVSGVSVFAEEALLARKPNGAQGDPFPKQRDTLYAPKDAYVYKFLADGLERTDVTKSLFPSAVKKDGNVTLGAFNKDSPYFKYHLGFFPPPGDEQMQRIHLEMPTDQQKLEQLRHETHERAVEEYTRDYVLRAPLYTDEVIVKGPVDANRIKLYQHLPLERPYKLKNRKNKN